MKLITAVVVGCALLGLMVYGEYQYWTAPLPENCYRTLDHVTCEYPDGSWAHIMPWTYWFD